MSAAAASSRIEPVFSLPTRALARGGEYAPALAAAHASLARMSVTIRPVTKNDYAQWLPLWDGYNAFYGRSGPTALDPAITRTTWARFFDANEPVHALVAEEGGGHIGLEQNQNQR